MVGNAYITLSKERIAIKKTICILCEIGMLPHFDEEDVFAVSFSFVVFKFISDDVSDFSLHPIGDWNKSMVLIASGQPTLLTILLIR